MDKGCLITVVFMAALCLAAAGCILFAIRSGDDEAVLAGASGGAAQEPVAIARIPWNEIDTIYRVTPKPTASSRSPASQWPELEGKVGTDLKKESSWANYKGRFVEWEGEFVEAKHSADRTTVSIKMNESTATKKDIILALKKTRSETAKAKQLKPGDRLRFRGRLKSWGSVVQFAMDKGEILE